MLMVNFDKNKKEGVLSVPFFVIPTIRVVGRVTKSRFILFNLTFYWLFWNVKVTYGFINSINERWKKINIEMGGGGVIK